MTRVLLAFAMLILLATGGALVLRVAEAQGPPDGTYTPVGFGDLGLDEPWVRLEGTAHYPSQLVQTMPATLLDRPRTLYVFGFFPVNDTAGRAIPVLVRTEREPERLVSFETMTVEGRLRPMGRATVKPEVEAKLSGNTEYFFDDGMLVLDAYRIESEDGVWERPE